MENWEDAIAERLRSAHDHAIALSSEHGDGDLRGHALRTVVAEGCSAITMGLLSLAVELRLNRESGGNSINSRIRRLEERVGILMADEAQLAQDLDEIKAAAGAAVAKVNSLQDQVNTLVNIQNAGTPVTSDQLNGLVATAEEIKQIFAGAAAPAGSTTDPSAGGTPDPSAAGGTGTTTTDPSATPTTDAAAADQGTVVDPAQTSTDQPGSTEPGA